MRKRKGPLSEVLLGRGRVLIVENASFGNWRGWFEDDPDNKFTALTKKALIAKGVDLNHRRPAKLVSAEPEEIRYLET